MSNAVASSAQIPAPADAAWDRALQLLVGPDTSAFNTAILNSLAAEIAVIDLNGVIRQVNDPWRVFASANGVQPSVPAPHTDIGTNYLAVCAATADSAEGLSPSYAGILGVLSGDLPRFAMEYPCHSPTEERWFAMCVLPLGSGQRTGAVIAHTDISEYKRMARALQTQNDALEIARAAADKANRAKSEFLSSMSHELRTPLGAILGFAQLLETGLPPPTPIQQRSVDQILQAGWYQLALINDILDLALVESGKLSLSLEPVPLSEVMTECEAMVEVQAAQRGVSVVFMQPRASLFVHADRTRLKQVLSNLLTNAIKYNTLGGSVVVDCFSTQPGRLRIGVADTGVGLSRQQIAQLFQPFNRLGQEAGGEEGTGIGLVMAKRLVELMDGSIGVDSECGRGSMFWIDLALVPLPAAQPSDAALLACTAGPPEVPAVMHTLLYVEDNPANLMLVEAVMARRTDVRLLSARDGPSGLALVRSSLPDVVLMDINLPGMSGLQALAVLKNDPALQHIPVIALSANAMSHDIERGLANGFLSYLTKPIKISALTKALDEAFALSAATKAASAAPHHPKDLT